MATHRQCSRADRAAPTTDTAATCCATPGQHLPRSAAFSGLSHRHHCRYGAWPTQLACRVASCSALSGKGRKQALSRSCTIPEQLRVCAVLANSCFQRPSLQTAVHEAGGTYLLLSQCQVTAVGRTLCQILLEPQESNKHDDRPYRQLKGMPSVCDRWMKRAP